jgi:hypothetical protein
VTVGFEHFRRVRLEQPSGARWLAAPEWVTLRGSLARPAWRAGAAPRIVVVLIFWALAGVLLFFCYLHVSRTIPVNSDGASNALQAWAMLHGNPLLRGWQLSDVSFYTTELPEYMLVEAVRGLGPDVVHEVAALTYTTVVLSVALLAKGGSRGVDGLVRAGLAAGIMLAPQGTEVVVLLLSPDHVGSTIPVLLLWLVIDRAGRRWLVPPACFLALTWALVADQIVIITGVLPLAAVGLTRAYRILVVRREGARAAAFDLALVVAALAAAEAAWRVLALIRASGGFAVWPVTTRTASLDSLGPNFLQTVHGILLLYGADFLGQPAGTSVAIAFVHLTGIALAAWALGTALRRFGVADIVVQLLAVAVLLSLLAYLLGPNAGEALSSREFAAVLPFGAALAGRLLTGRLRRGRLVPALGLVLAVYLSGLVRVAALPPAPARNQAAANWLAAHNLSYGLGEYWMANEITLDSRGAVRVRSLKSDGSSVKPDRWETDQSWYSASEQLANFVVLPTDAPLSGPGPVLGPGPYAPTAAEVLHAFGQPAHVWFLPDYTILVWDKNLLAYLP